MDYKATEARTYDVFSPENDVVEPETETRKEFNKPVENQQEYVETELERNTRLSFERREAARRAAPTISFLEEFPEEFREELIALNARYQADSKAYMKNEALVLKNVAAIFLGMLAMGLDRAAAVSIIEECAIESKNGDGKEVLERIIRKLYDSERIATEKLTSPEMERYLLFIMNMDIDYQYVLHGMNGLLFEEKEMFVWSINKCPKYFAANFPDYVSANYPGYLETCFADYDEEGDFGEEINALLEEELDVIFEEDRGADDVLRGGYDTGNPEDVYRIFKILDSRMNDVVLSRLMEPTNKNRRISPGSPESFFYQLAEEHQNVYIKDKLDERYPDNWGHKLLWGLSRGYYLNKRCYNYYEKYQSPGTPYCLDGVFPDEPVVLEDNESLFTYWIEKSDGWSMDEISDPCMNALYVEEFRKEDTLLDRSSLRFIHEGIRPLSGDEIRKLDEYYYGPVPNNEQPEEYPEDRPGEYSEGQSEDEEPQTPHHKPPPTQKVLPIDLPDNLPLPKFRVEAKLDELFANTDVYSQWSKKPEKITPGTTLQRTVSEPLDKPRNESVSVYADEDTLTGGNYIKAKIMVAGREVELVDPYANGGENKVDPQLISVWYYTELEIISRKLYTAGYESRKYFRGRVNLKEYKFWWPDMGHGSIMDVSGFVTGLMLFLIIIKDADVKTIVSEDIFEYLPDGCVTYSDVNGRRQKHEYFEFEITEDFSLKIFLPPTYRYCSKSLIKGVIGGCVVVWRRYPN